MRNKAAALFLICVSIAVWVSCAKTSSRFLYAAIPNANDIVVYREDPNSGILTVLAGSPIAAGPAVQALALHPNKKFLYAANSAESDISVFAISSTGALTEMTPRIQAGTSPILMAIDATGSFLYVANLGSTDLYTYSIGSGGASLSQVGQPFLLGLSPLNMKLSSAGILFITFAGVAANLPGPIEAVTLSNGAPVSAIQVGQAGTEPNGLLIDSSGTHLYTANSVDNTISEFSISSSGNLTELPGSPIQSNSSPEALLIDNSGKLLFVANTSANNIGAFSIGSDGSLTVVSANPSTPCNAQPSFLAIDPSGKYIFVGNQSSPAIQSFSLDDSTGQLTSVASYAVGNTPSSIVVTQ